MVQTMAACREFQTAGPHTQQMLSFQTVSVHWMTAAFVDNIMDLLLQTISDTYNII